MELHDGVNLSVSATADIPGLPDLDLSSWRWRRMAPWREIFFHLLRSAGMMTKESWSYRNAR